MYKLSKLNIFTKTQDQVVRLVDGAFIPFDPDNTDYQAYLKWLEESPDNIPLPADEGTV